MERKARPMTRFNIVSVLTILILTLFAHAAFSVVGDEDRLNLNMKEVPFPEVIRYIFSGSPDKFSVAPALNDIKVSATLKNVTRDEAIRVVSRSAGVVYSVENSTYTFKPDPRAANVQSYQVQTKSDSASGPANVGMVTLSYISAGDAASLLNASPPDGLQGVTATSVNTLMIKGSTSSIDQAVELIKLFDVESALPRSVRVLLSLEYGAAGTKGPAKLTTESVGPEGSPMPLSVNYSNKEGGSCMLDVRLTPNVLPDGSVSLAGSGGIDCNSGGGTEAQRMSRAFEVAVSVPVGTRAIIAAGSAEEGNNNMRFTVWVTPTVDKGRVVIPRGGVSASGTGFTQPAQDTWHPAATIKQPIDSHHKAADALLQQIWDAQPGQAKFDAIDAVAKKYKESDLAGQNAIAWLCVTYMKNTHRGILDRWPCCYVISRCGCEQGLPDLIDVLRYDNHEVMRAVAAEALGGWSDNAIAHDALIQAERAEKSKGVREVLARYLGSDILESP